MLQAVLHSAPCQGSLPLAAKLLVFHPQPHPGGTTAYQALVRGWKQSWQEHHLLSLFLSEVQKFPMHKMFLICMPSFFKYSTVSWSLNNTRVRGPDPLCGQKSAYNFTVSPLYPCFRVHGFSRPQIEMYCSTYLLNKICIWVDLCHSELCWSRVNCIWNVCFDSFVQFYGCFLGERICQSLYSLIVGSPCDLTFARQFYVSLSLNGVKLSKLPLCVIILSH